VQQEVDELGDLEIVDGDRRLVGRGDAQAGLRRAVEAHVPHGGPVHGAPVERAPERSAPRSLRPDRSAPVRSASASTGVGEVGAHEVRARQVGAGEHRATRLAPAEPGAGEAGCA
jgi:hypothetical protein